MYQLTADENVVLLLPNTFVTKDGAGWDQYVAWVDAGNTAAPYQPQSWDASGKPI